MNNENTYDKYMKIELYNAQEKLRMIDNLVNCIQKIDNNDLKNEIAYLIHQIVESEDGISSSLARDIQHYQIIANKELFFSEVK